MHQAQPHPNHGGWRRALLATLLIGAGARAAAIDVAIMDRPSNDSDRRRDYVMLLLHDVMESTLAQFGPYRIEFAAFAMERPRLLLEMQQGRSVNIAANPANAEWLAKLPSVPIPIDQGLQSWRLLLIDERNQQRLQRQAAAGQLRQARAGAGASWAIHDVMVRQGYATISGNSYDGLFLMLKAGRFGYMPRGVHEIFSEFEHYRERFPELAVENSVVLHVPIPSLLFISPQHPRLRRRVAVGMEAMLRDGSLERLVLAYYHDDLVRAQLCQRTRIDLPNIELDPAMQARRELWFDPTDPRHGLCRSAAPGMAPTGGHG